MNGYPLASLDEAELARLICVTGALALPELDGCNPDTCWGYWERTLLREWARRHGPALPALGRQVAALAAAGQALGALGAGR